LHDRDFGAASGAMRDCFDLFEEVLEAGDEVMKHPAKVEEIEVAQTCIHGEEQMPAGRGDCEFGALLCEKRGVQLLGFGQDRVAIELGEWVEIQGLGEKDDQLGGIMIEHIDQEKLMQIDRKADDRFGPAYFDLEISGDRGSQLIELGLRHDERG